MQEALDRLREVLLAPSIKGIGAVLCALWAALVHNASDAFLISLACVMALYAIDGVLGVWHAAKDGRFSRACFPRFISKAILYSLFAWVFFFSGAAFDALIGSSEGRLNFVLITAANTMLAVTEALSAIDHFDALTGGTVNVAGLRRLLEQLREMRTQELTKRQQGDGS